MAEFLRDHWPEIIGTAIVWLINRANWKTPKWWTVKHPVARILLRVLEGINVVQLRMRKPDVVEPPREQPRVFPD